MPAATPPMSAGFHFTLVLGTSMYTAVKMAATMKYGETFCADARPTARRSGSVAADARSRGFERLVRQRR